MASKTGSRATSAARPALAQLVGERVAETPAAQGVVSACPARPPGTRNVPSPSSNAIMAGSLFTRREICFRISRAGHRVPAPRRAGRLPPAPRAGFRLHPAAAFRRPASSGSTPCRSRAISSRRASNTSLRYSSRPRAVPPPRAGADPCPSASAKCSRGFPDTIAGGANRPLQRERSSVCAANVDRSPTAAGLYEGDPRYEVHSAGTAPFATIPLTREMLRRARPGVRDERARGPDRTLIKMRFPDLGFAGDRPRHRGPPAPRPP